MAGLKKIILKNSTQMSLHERFTYLRQPTRQEGTVQTVRANLALQQQASARNRRLAAQMERRPAVMAALKIKQKTLRQRLGISRPSLSDRLTIRPMGQMRSQSVPRSPRARLSIGVRGRVYRPQAQFTPIRQTRVPGPVVRQRGTLSRSASLGNLSRSQSTGNLNTAGRFQNQIQNRNFQNTNRFNVNKTVPFRPQRGMRGTRSRGFIAQRPYRGGRGQIQVQGQRRGQFNPQQRGQRGGRGNFRRGTQTIRGSQGVRGSQGRGRGRGGRGRGGRPAPPSKEELDKQLDQYMASTKSTLDKELDSYMNQSNEMN